MKNKLAKRPFRPLNGHNQPLIQIRDVVKRFPVGDSEITVLNGINLHVYPGEFVCIVGPSGNGKSTLLNMITGIDRPSAGEIIIEEKAIQTLTENELAIWRGERIGVIFQFFQMLPALSLVQNVKLPMDLVKKLPPKEREPRARALLDQVGLTAEADKLPSMVSGGQQQRAAIARALANDPPIIVADEPTGNLDTRTEEAIFSIFEALAAGGKTLLMVTHSPRLAERIPRQIEIANGRIHRDSAPPKARGFSGKSKEIDTLIEEGIDLLDTILDRYLEK